MSIIKRLFGLGSSKAPPAKGSAQEERMSLYIFNSDEIDRSVSSRYGAYAEGQILSALHKVVQSLGGWRILDNGLVGCHGDLFDQALRVLAQWATKESGISIRIEGDFIEKITAGPSDIGYVPYAIGICALLESITNSVHKSLRSSSAIGYLGNISVVPDPRLPNPERLSRMMQAAGLSDAEKVYSAMASTLGLPVKLGIRSDAQCFGWLVSDSEMGKIGLTRLELPR